MNPADPRLARVRGKISPPSSNQPKVEILNSGPEEPDNGRLIAIGDIHGHAKALRAILDQIQPSADDTIITLGDCVNRGPDSRGVLECLLDIQEVCRLIPILGNHDEMMALPKYLRLHKKQ